LVDTTIPEDTGDRDRPPPRHVSGRAVSDQITLASKASAAAIAPSSSTRPIETGRCIESERTLANLHAGIETHPRG
jgi:hypothetical protein